MVFQDLCHRCVLCLWTSMFNRKLDSFVFRYRNPITEAVDALVALWNQYIFIYAYEMYPSSASQHQLIFFPSSLFLVLTHRFEARVLKDRHL